MIPTKQSFVEMVSHGQVDGQAKPKAEPIQIMVPISSQLFGFNIH